MPKARDPLKTRTIPRKEIEKLVREEMKDRPNTEDDLVKRRFTVNFEKLVIDETLNHVIACLQEIKEFANGCGYDMSTLKFKEVTARWGYNTDLTVVGMRPMTDYEWEQAIQNKTDIDIKNARKKERKRAADARKAAATDEAEYKQFLKLQKKYK